MSRVCYVLAALILIAVIDQINCQCASNQCPNIFNVNLDVSPNKTCYDITDDVSLTCSGSIGGPESNTCLGNGGPFSGWQLPPSTTCEVWNCPQPSTSDAALNFIPDSSSYYARETVTYSCDQGYSLQGADSATCDSENTWNPSAVPTCIVTCEDPSIANGGLMASEPYTDGTTVTVLCDSGYTLESGASSSITCQSNSTWDSVPQCYQSCNVTSVTNSDLTSNETITHGTSKTINCLSGYSYNQEATWNIQCNSGTLDQTVPEACYQDCAPLSAPTNGGISGGNLHGENVTYSCNRGYLLNETATDTCNDGTWQNGGNAPTCYKKSLQESISLYCNPDIFIVVIPEALLGDNPSVSSVSMGTCQGTTLSGGYLYVNSSYNDCDTVMEIDTSAGKVYYRNLVTDADSSPVTTCESLDISVECVFDQNNRVSSSAVIQNRVTKDLSSTGNYDLSFASYTDSSYQNEIDSSVRVDTNSEIYLLAQVNYVTNIDLFGSRCYATPSPEENYFLYYDLILDGCNASSYVTGISDNEVSNPNFAFALKVFRFTASDSDSIYIHCDLKICENGVCPVPSDCTSARRKRSTHISLSKYVIAGPIKMNTIGETENATDGAWQFTALTIYSVTVSALLVSALGIVGLISYHRRRQPTPKRGAGYSRI